MIEEHSYLLVILVDTDYLITIENIGDRLEPNIPF